MKISALGWRKNIKAEIPDPSPLIRAKGAGLSALRYFFGIVTSLSGRLYQDDIGGRREDVMTTTSETVNKEFKVWMTVTLGLIKDGKMGASQARADRIKTAMGYAKKNG